MSTEASSEEVLSLIDAYRAGNDAAMTKLNQLLSNKIKRCCSKHLAKNKAANLLVADYSNVIPDLEAEVWENILKLLSGDKVEPLSDTPIPYILGIAKNKTLTFADRIAAKQKNGGSSTLNNFESYDLDLGEEPESKVIEQPSIDSILYNSSTIESLLNELSPTEKELYLHIAEGLKLEEIKEKMGISLRSVKYKKEAIIDKLGAYAQRNNLTLPIVSD